MAYYPKGRQNKSVNLRMPKKSKKVLKENRISSSSWIKK
jgi:hypothetical protein